MREIGREHFVATRSVDRGFRFIGLSAYGRSDDGSEQQCQEREESRHGGSLAGGAGEGANCYYSAGAASELQASKAACCFGKGEMSETFSKTDATPSPKPSWLASRICGLVDAFTVIGVGITIIAWGARWHWFCDLLTHFPLQLAVGGTVCAVVQASMRRWRWASVSLAAVLFNVWLLAPYLLSGSSFVAESSATAKVISANLLHDNLDYERFIEYIREEEPDVFFVMELNDHWVQALSALEQEYPHKVLRPRGDAFGAGLYSRLPLVEQQVIKSSADVPSIMVRVEIDGMPVTILGTHPLPPIGASNAAERNEQLAEMASLAASVEAPLVLVGDLNITPWSPYFGDFIRASGLRDSQRGQGLQPSWPNLPWLCRIPIDHALTSNEVQVVERRLGAAIGSDHRPVVLTFGVARKAP
jgi:endonuclease/exonuclease/phosphatase (EEP) superfamily protein YafD